MLSLILTPDINWLHGGGGEGWNRLATVLFSVIYQCIFQKNFVYFPVTVDKDVDLEQLQAVLHIERYVIATVLNGM